MSGKAVSMIFMVIVSVAALLMAMFFLLSTAYDPTLTWDQRVYDGAVGIVLIAILLGVSVTCVFRGARVRIG